MKKLLTCAILISAINLAAIAHADTGLSCKDIVGIWHGDLDKLVNVTLYIESEGGGSWEDANISWHESNPDTGYTNDASFGLLVGRCQQNPNGTVVMNLTRNSYGVSSNVNTQLLSPTELNVSFSYSIMYANNSGSGILHK